LYQLRVFQLCLNDSAEHYGNGGNKHGPSYFPCRTNLLNKPDTGELGKISLAPSVTYRKVDRIHFHQFIASRKSLDLREKENVENLVYETALDAFESIQE
jgi:hypothetical protein